MKCDPFQTDGGMQKQEIALLNEQQTTLLITYMRNNEVVREFKKRLVYEFFTMRSALAKKKMDRNSARLEYKPMTDAIKHEREAQGKQIAPHHFSNEADLINRLALGMTAAKFRVHHEIGKKEPIRDYLTPEQIHCITELQRANTVFISMGWDFEQRKEVLRGMFERNHRQPLIGRAAPLGRITTNLWFLRATFTTAFHYKAHLLVGLIMVCIVFGKAVMTPTY